MKDKNILLSLERIYKRNQEYEVKKENVFSFYQFCLEGTVGVGGEKPGGRAQ
jgi:hypothetical protein